MPKRIWTYDTYKTMARSLLEHFGPCDTAVLSGPNWDAWCEAFSIVAQAKSGEAVAAQVRIYMMPVSAPYYGRGHQRSRILALAAALEAGLWRHAICPRSGRNRKKTAMKRKLLTWTRI